MSKTAALRGHAPLHLTMSNLIPFPSKQLITAPCNTAEPWGIHELMNVTLIAALVMPQRPFRFHCDYRLLVQPL